MKATFRKVKDFISSAYKPQKVSEFPDTDTFVLLGNQLLQAAIDAKDIHYALRNREGILSVISQAAFNFLDPNINAWRHLSSFIKELGQTMAVDRIFFLNYTKEKDTLSILEKHIYEKPGLEVSLFKTYDQFKNISRKDYFEIYFQNKTITWRLDDKLRPGLLHHLRIFRVKSLCVVPIISDKKLLGCMVIQDCTISRRWSKLELNALQTISNLLSAWRKRNALEKSLKVHREHLEQTVQKRTEELYRSNEIFRSLTESSPDSIVRFDCNHKCIFVNKVVSRHSGVSMDKFLSLPLDSLFPNEAAQIIKNVLDYIIENGEGFNVELQFPKTKLWIDWKFEPEFNSLNEVCNITAVGRNITRRKLADSTLTEYLDHQTKSALVQESSYKTIFEILNFPAIICNTSNLIVDSNKLAKDLFCEEQLIGINCSELFMNKDYAVEYKKHIQDQGEKSCNFVGKLITKDDIQIFKVTISAVPNTKNFVCVFEKNC